MSGLVHVCDFAAGGRRKSVYVAKAVLCAMGVNMFTRVNRD